MMSQRRVTVLPILILFLLPALVLTAPAAIGQCDPQQVDKVVPWDPAQNDAFGVSLAISGDTVIVGATGDDSFRGSVYIFGELFPGNWLQIFKIRPADNSTSDFFGGSVSLSGDIALIGASGDDDRGANSGSAYLFEHDGFGNWNQIGKLLASDGAAEDRFGGSVAIDGANAIVGALNDDGFRGAAYIFGDDGNGNWSQLAKIRAADGAGFDFFGCAVALSGDTAVVGAYGDSDLGFGSGSAYVFRDDGNGNWTQLAKVVASDGAELENFGWSVSIDSDTAIVGAWGHERLGAETGAAYLFADDGNGNWSEVSKIVASDGTDRDYFGGSVSVSGDVALVGAYKDGDQGNLAGSAYLFQHDGNGNWSEAAKISSSDVMFGDQFGYSVAVDGNRALVGAIGDDGFRGSAYAYEVNCQRDFQLAASGTCPGRVTVEWTGATPDESVALIFAKNTGSFVIPFGPCQGTVLGLGPRSIQLVGVFPSGPGGSGVRSGNSQSGACLGYMQMHEIPSCITSNVVQHP